MLKNKTWKIKLYEDLNHQGWKKIIREQIKIFSWKVKLNWKIT
jgi:hypothetical protein